MPLALWDERIFSHILAVYRESAQPRPDISPFGYVVFGVANLGWYANQGNNS